MNDTEKKPPQRAQSGPAGAAEAVTHEPAQEAAEKPAEGNTGVYTHVFKKPFEYEGKTYTELTFNFERLSGRDMVSIETEMQMNNEYALAPEISRSFSREDGGKGRGHRKRRAGSNAPERFQQDHQRGQKFLIDTGF